MKEVQRTAAASILSLTLTGLAGAFEFPKLPTVFKPPTTPGRTSASLGQKKADLLEAVCFTQNGKTASPSLQARVLSMVREIEKEAPPSDGLLSDPDEAMALDGVWFLQYTSPSEIENESELLLDDTWTPEAPSEDGAVETKQFKAKGTVSAVGITVDTSNRVVKQIFDVANSEVANEVNFDWGRLTVRGPFRRSDNVSNRAIVAFKDLKIELNSGPVLNLGFVFAAIAALKGADVGGWLETSFVSEDMRIGRGNKGTMFVLTRDQGAVKP